MKNIKLVLLIIFILGISNAVAQVATPVIKSASFDSSGRLVVSATHEGIEGCYLTVNGGLTRSKVETGIVSIQLSAAEAAQKKARIHTKRRYYCAKRTLYVNLELVCLNSIIGQATSDVVAVKVPTSNVRR